MNAYFPFDASLLQHHQQAPSPPPVDRLATPPRTSTPIRQHGSLLLPRIRPQDQNLGSTTHAIAPMPTKKRRSPAGVTKKRATPSASHVRSKTNPEALQMALNMASSSVYMTPPPAEADHHHHNQLLNNFQHLYQPLPFDLSRRASSVSSLPVELAVDPVDYRQMSLDVATHEMYPYGQTTLRDDSPFSIESTPDPTPSTTLLSYLSAANPAASLVRSISFPMRDPTIKHFWWDIRAVRPWAEFSLPNILALPGAADLLSTPVPAPLLPATPVISRHPETEAALHGIYASSYLPKLNAALALSSSRPIQIHVPARLPAAVNDHVFVASAAHDPATAAAMFGGKPSARVVGIVRSFDRFNTGMRAEGNIKRVEYLRGLAAIHHAMREHNCRYGFILTEVELVVVRNGTESTPFFGELDIASVQLGVAAADPQSATLDNATLTACIALWGLCQIAGDAAVNVGHAPYMAEIGAPAEGTRRKAGPRDSWIPQPQLAEKREAKRSRGWIWPEDPIGKKEVGKRGVKYSNA